MSVCRLESEVGWGPNPLHSDGLYLLAKLLIKAGGPLWAGRVSLWAIVACQPRTLASDPMTA